MGTDISKVAKSIIQMQTGVKTDKSSKKLIKYHGQFYGTDESEHTTVRYSDKYIK